MLVVARERRAAGEAGMVTAELAVTMPAMVLLLVLLLGALSVASDRIRCGDAARVTARHLARGETVAMATGTGGEMAPSGAGIHVTREGRRVTVIVSQPERDLLGLRFSGCRGQAHAEVEAVDGKGP